MKKTLVAIAAIAAAGASFAQTTVYGKADIGLFNTAAGTSVGTGGYEGSRFGVKAEDKAAGMTFSAQLEGSVTGTDAGFTGFGRVATLGVTGSFGNITVGQQWTPYDNATWTSDPAEYAKFSTLRATSAWNYDIGNTGGGNAKGSVQYTTPVVGGFQGIVLSAPNVTGGTATNYSGLGLNYAAGALVINYASQAYSSAGVATVNSNVLAVNYDFGAAKAYGGIFSTDSGTLVGGKDSSYIAGVAVPFGADSLRLSVASNKTSVTGAADNTSSAWSAMYLKPLSKAAMGYAGYLSLNSVTTSGVGIRYNF